MKLEGQNTLALPLEEAWRRISDPRALRACIPGLEQLDARDADHYDAVLEVKLPSVYGRFEGSLEYTERRPPERLRLHLSGKGPLGFVDGDVALALAASGESSTQVSYSADVQIGGQIARLGQRMISGISREMAVRFFGALERWRPEAPDEKVAPSAAAAMLPLAGGAALRALGLRKNDE